MIATIALPFIAQIPQNISQFRIGDGDVVRCKVIKKASRLSNVDVQHLLASTCGDRPADIRDHAILMLLALYGLRRGEVAGLQLGDLDWEGEMIHVARPKQRVTQCYPRSLTRLRSKSSTFCRCLRTTSKTDTATRFVATTMNVPVTISSRRTPLGITIIPHSDLRHHSMTNGISKKLMPFCLKFFAHSTFNQREHQTIKLADHTHCTASELPICRASLSTFQYGNNGMNAPS